MSRSITASVSRMGDVSLIAIKWRLHQKGPSRSYPTMRMTVTPESAAELHAALGEALAQYKADPAAKLEASNDRHKQ
jgi:hypothetical protein